jgi:hypothetical protein
MTPHKGQPASDCCSTAYVILVPTRVCVDFAVRAAWIGWPRLLEAGAYSATP